MGAGRGAVDLVRRVGREDTVVARMDVPGRWAGGFRAWDEHGVYLATGRGASDGRLLRVPAMDGRGTLRVATRAEDDGVVVEIGDTGPGMPPEVAGRAFDAFYTTKDVGKGTGLGLDIARRIITERHGGTITIDSRPGDTVLRVRLPVRPPAPRA